MPFDVVFDFAYDQQRVLLEHSKLQGVGDADLFRNRFLARASRPLEQISSRLCALSALFALLLLIGMRLKSFSFALSWLFAEFRYPIFFYERSGSDFARICCPVARHLVHQARYGSGPRRSGFEDL